MRQFLRVSICAAWFSVLTLSVARGQEVNDGAAPEGPKLNWQQGPMVGQLGYQAQIEVPENYAYLNGDETRNFMQMLHNPVDGSELGTVAPKESDWFVVFEFNNSGYVKDDEGGKLDADAILTSLKEGNKIGNTERLKRGWSSIEIVGWQEKPNYDPKTHNLQWCTNATSDGRQIVNYNTRILGRSGVMVVTLVANPEQLPEVLPAFKKLLTGFQYTSGHNYAEFRPGDKMAEYGLTALVAGGGLAVAAKTGLLAKLGIFVAKAWKAVAIGFIALLAGVKKLFGGRKSTAG